MSLNIVLRTSLFILIFLSITSTVYAQESPTADVASVCMSLPQNLQAQCRPCFEKAGVWTALGCIPADPNAFVGTLLRFAIGIGGGLAFLLILFGGFQILMSTGNPENLNAGKELVGGAVAGLIFIIFSLFILKTIGATMLGIPGFK